MLKTVVINVSNFSSNLNASLAILLVAGTRNVFVRSWNSKNDLGLKKEGMEIEEEVDRTIRVIFANDRIGN